MIKESNPKLCDLCLGGSYADYGSLDPKLTPFEDDVIDWEGTIRHIKGEYCPGCFQWFMYRRTSVFSQEDFEEEQKMINAYEAESANDR